MLTRLSGLLIEKIAPTAVIDVNGVGYEVDLPLNTFYQLPALGENVVLWTHLSVREDAHQLFGFSDRNMLQTFRTLIKVSGVGPRLALAILSGMDTEALRVCLAQEDITTLTRIPGVGKKTAERLIIELRDKLGKPALKVLGQASGNLSLMPTLNASEEAEQALVALGYKPIEAQRAIKAVANKELETAELVRAALKGLLRN
ncbi:MAG: Holliday junction branch migration protein RuvA [Moraxellaceae bacterium]|nr:Holliday junction branch migration protein RuvA [Moraxellaceae bacterium]